MVALTNVGASYDAIDASQGLGIGLINFTGIAQILFEVRVKKIGTGAQRWQLWNETDAAEIGVIIDSGAATVKTLGATFPVNLSGVKRIRVRALSSVAADDPIFFGAAVLPITA